MIDMPWEDVETCCMTLFNSIQQQQLKFDKIVGISRGGLIPATCMGYLLSLPVTSLQWQTRSLNTNQDFVSLNSLLDKKDRLLIVDNIIDSGRTFYEIMCHILFNRPAYPLNNIVFSALLKRKKQDYSLPNSMLVIIGNEIENGPWVNFPWDNINRHKQEE